MEVFNEILGVKLKVPDEPERIISLAPNITETLFMLGLEEKIVAVSYYCNKPPEAKKKPKVGSYWKADFEKILNLKPDLVLTTTGAQRETNKKLLEKGIPVYPLQLPTSIHGILENIWVIGNLTNRIDEARALIEKLEEKLMRVLQNKPGRRVRVYWEICLGGPITAGAPSYVDTAITLAGGENIFKDKRQNYFQPDFEEVKQRDPEIFLYEPQPNKEMTIEKLKEMIKERGWEEVTAIKRNNIFITESDFLAHYGPSLFDAVEWLNSKINEII